MSRFVKVAQQGNNHAVLYVFTVIVVIFAAFLGQVPLQWVISGRVKEGKITSEMEELFNQTADFNYLEMPSWLTLFLLLISFVVALGVLLTAVRYGHDRSPLTLITPNRRIAWNKILFGAGLWFVLTGVAELVMYAGSPEVYRFTFDAAAWIPLLLVSLFILPLQTSFEEMFTRGYLLQGFGLATHRKWAAVVLSSLFFAAMHLGNPEIETFGLGVMLLYYISVAVFLAIVTFLDDGLEFALGIHAATNIYGASCVSFTGSALRTEALIQVDQVNPWHMLLLAYVMMAVFYVIVKKKFGLSPLRSLSGKMHLEPATPIYDV